jgi:hypothetical protein
MSNQVGSRDVSLWIHENIHMETKDSIDYARPRHLSKMPFSHGTVSVLENDTSVTSFCFYPGLVALTRPVSFLESESQNWAALRPEVVNAGKGEEDAA